MAAPDAAASTAARAPRVALFCAAFDPVTCNDLRVASEAIRSGECDQLWLVPFGSDYVSAAGSSVGVGALNRFLACHVAVEFEFEAAVPVFAADVELFGRTTADVIDAMAARVRRSGGVLSVLLKQPHSAKPMVSPTTGSDSDGEEDDNGEYGGAEAVAASDIAKYGPGPGAGVGAGASAMGSSGAGAGAYDDDARRRDGGVAGDAARVFGTARSAARRVARHHTHVAGAAECPLRSDRWPDIDSTRIEAELSRRKPRLSGLVPLAVQGFLHRYGVYTPRPLFSAARAGPGGVKRELAHDAAAGGAATFLHGIGDRTGHGGGGARSAGMPAPAHRRRRRIALLGGSFHPVTTAHTRLAADVLASGAADAVWLVPCGPRPDKPSLHTPPLQRFLMCVLAVEAEFPPSAAVIVTCDEVFEPKALASYTLLTRLSKWYADHSFSLVIGADLVPTLDKWQYADLLRRECSFLVVDRPGYAPLDGEHGIAPAMDLPPHATVLRDRRGHALRLFELSSSEVRAILAAVPAADAGARSTAVYGLMPPPVVRFIVRNALFPAPSGGKL